MRKKLKQTNAQAFQIFISSSRKLLSKNNPFVKDAREISQFVRSAKQIKTRKKNGSPFSCGSCKRWQSRRRCRACKEETKKEYNESHQCANGFESTFGTSRRRVEGSASSRRRRGWREPSVHWRALSRRQEHTYAHNNNKIENVEINIRARTRQ